MLDDHLGFIADSVRLELFRSAIAVTVNSGDYVVDLGCGSGILGSLCYKAGALRIIGIDSTEMIEVARQIFERSGLGERGLFIRGLSQRVILPKATDVVICDHVGYFGFDYGIIQTLKDARTRFLKPGGHLIPAGMWLHLGAVESDSARAKSHGWAAADIPPEYNWLCHHTVNEKHGLQLAAETILGPEAVLGYINFYTDQPDFFSWTAKLTIERDGVVHGLAGWFNCKLAEGVWMTNSPLAKDAIDRPQAFLPIDEAVPVRAGEVINATVMARPDEHLIAWVVEFPTSGRRFSHSTWQGMLMAPEDLTRAKSNRVPRLSHEGQARMTVLQSCDGQRSAHDIERLVLENHPDLFPTRQEISRFVMQVLGRDTD